jgi:hypothetical protein
MGNENGPFVALPWLLAKSVLDVSTRGSSKASGTAMLIVTDCFGALNRNPEVFLCKVLHSSANMGAEKADLPDVAGFAYCGMVLNLP